MKIYIGGISDEVTEKDLETLYSQYGHIEKVDLLKDPEGKNRGYAFVKFTTEDEAESAILGTNNTLLGGNNISVSISRSRLDQKRARQSRGIKRGPQRPNENRNYNDREKNFVPRENQRNNKNRHNRSFNPIRKGVDYGRSSYNTSQTSFLGQEDFGASPRTMDMHPNNNNAPKYPNKKRNFNRNYNVRPNTKPTSYVDDNKNYNSLDI